MKLLSRMVLLGVALTMSVCGAACNEAAPGDGEAETDESALSPGAILDLGPIVPGETKVVDSTPLQGVQVL